VPILKLCTSTRWQVMFKAQAHLLRFDSVHGQWDKDVSIKDDALVIDGQPNWLFSK
jgi:glyceraldehyde-3-phosphate dehydrogenase/erythrose-4-phosphate dehydrogenase